MQTDQSEPQNSLPPAPTQWASAARPPAVRQPQLPPPSPPQGTLRIAAPGEPFFKALFERLVGIRASYGPDAAVIRIASRAGMRNRLNWYTPVFGFLLGLSALIFGGLVLDNASQVPARVFMVDSILLFFGGLSGWNMARAWRDNSDQVEELSLTPLPPGVVASAFVAGPVSIWIVVIGALAAVDIVFPAGLYHLDFSGASGGAPIPLKIMGALAVHLLVVPAFAWFHLETVRLSHWLFVVHALPRISLRRAGLLNLLAITGIIWGLATIGTMITGLFVLILGIFAVVSKSNVASSPIAWEFASIPALLLIALCKRQLCRVYEAAFLRAWLLYQWAGAGERTQPEIYPRHYLEILPFWQAFYEMAEEENAGLPIHRRKATQRFNEICERIRERREEQRSLMSAIAAVEGKAAANDPGPRMPPDQRA